MLRLLLSVLLIVVTFSISSCSDKPEQNIFFDELLKNARPANLHYEVQDNKTINGGTLVSARGEVPFDISRSEIKPTIFSCMKNLKQLFPECKWFQLYLIPYDKDILLQVATAELIENKIIIEYKIPTDTQIAEWNSEIGKEIIDEDGHSWGKNDMPQLFRPTEKTFDEYYKIVKAFQEERKTHSALDFSENDILKKVAGNLNKPVPYVFDAYKYMNWYYGLAVFDSEEIEL